MSEKTPPIETQDLDEQQKAGIKTLLTNLKKGLAQETAETKEMFEIYRQFTKGKASKEDLKKAEAQMQDLVRAAGLTIVGILPFAPLTIPTIIKLGEKLGIDILPSAFRKDSDTAPQNARQQDKSKLDSE